MEKIQWSPSFSVGVELLDQQHKQIINMINSLITTSESNIESEVVSDTLDRMTKYATKHFKTEESLLKQHEYPHLAKHRKEHKEYQKQLVDLCQKVMTHESGVSTELLQYLMNWWTQHILETDMQYRKFFMDKGRSEAD